MRERLIGAHTVLVVTLGALVGTIAPAQEAGAALTRADSAEREFETAAATHRWQFGHLLQSRGIPVHPWLEHTGVTTVDAVAAWLRRLDPSVALLMYGYQGDTLREWLISRRGLEAFGRQIVTPGVLDSLIAELRFALGVDAGQAARGFTAPRRNGKALPLAQTIRRLSELLIPDSVSREIARIKDLVVVPVLSIGTVPFALLQPPGWGSPLIDSMRVYVAPSLFDLGADLPANPPGVVKALVVGNPAALVRGLPPLPGAEEEARSVASLLGVPALTGGQATKAVVLERAPQAEILFFATHGVASSANPLDDSFLALTPDSGSNGRWTAREIQGMRLRARLVVLSACQTGLGKEHDAGIIGMARAFQLAGAPQVVMSLWSVDDEATKDLMQAFVRHLVTDERDPASALRLAMLELRGRRPDPAVWSPFVVFGIPR